MEIIKRKKMLSNSTQQKLRKLLHGGYMYENSTREIQRTRYCIPYTVSGFVIHETIRKIMYYIRHVRNFNLLINFKEKLFALPLLSWMESNNCCSCSIRCSDKDSFAKFLELLGLNSFRFQRIELQEMVRN